VAAAAKTRTLSTLRKRQGVETGRVGMDAPGWSVYKVPGSF
jgi:hypothetical protein